MKGGARHSVRAVFGFNKKPTKPGSGFASAFLVSWFHNLISQYPRHRRHTISVLELQRIRINLFST
jgi:hypothetical protein